MKTNGKHLKKVITKLIPAATALYARSAADSALRKTPEATIAITARTVFQVCTLIQSRETEPPIAEE